MRKRDAWTDDSDRRLGWCPCPYEPMKCRNEAEGRERFCSDTEIELLKV